MVNNGETMSTSAFDPDGVLLNASFNLVRGAHRKQKVRREMVNNGETMSTSAFDPDGVLLNVSINLVTANASSFSFEYEG